MRLIATATLAFAALTMLIGCAASPDTTPASPTPAPEPTPTPVESWSSDEPGEPKLTLFGDGTLGGFDGCNAFEGTYVRTDNLLELHLGYGTLKGCIGIDMWLRNASSAEIDGGSLIVYDATGNTIGTLTEA